MSTGEGFRSSENADTVPDGAKSFIKALQRALKSGGTRAEVVAPPSGNGKPRTEIVSLYEDQFHKLTERYFKATSWPAADHMAQFVEEDEPTLLLYKELYFRHIYAKLTPTLDDRFDSFQNYVDIFNLLLTFDSESPSFELPLSWVWELVDEFIYQFQSFHTYRNKVADLDEEELTNLREHQHMWSAQTVMQYLHALVRKSGLDISKKATEQTVDAAAEEGKPAVSTMFRTLGYFSLVGLLRVNTLLGDYATALSSLDAIDLRKHRSIFTGVLTCHLTLYYNMGLAYLMQRRYVDAIKVFCYFLGYTQRNKHLIARNHKADLVNKRVDQMLGLLGLAFVLSGGASSSGSGSGYDRESFAASLIDESIYHDLRDKLDDRLPRMRSGDLDAFEDVFTTSVPKFVQVCAPNYDNKENQHMAALSLQLKMFMSEVKSRSLINDLYSYLKLFTSVSLSKLGVFLGLDEEQTLALLLKLGHKSRTQRWAGGAPGDFIWQSLNEVNFTVQNDTVLVTQQRSQRRFGDYFVRQILRFEDLTKDVKSLKPIPIRR